MQTQIHIKNMNARMIVNVNIKTYTQMNVNVNTIMKYEDKCD